MLHAEKLGSLMQSRGRQPLASLISNAITCCPQSADIWSQNHLFCPAKASSSKELPLSPPFTFPSSLISTKYHLLFFPPPAYYQILSLWNKCTIKQVPAKGCHDCQHRVPFHPWMFHTPKKGVFKNLLKSSLGRKIITFREC